MKCHGCHNKQLLYYRPSNSQGLTTRLTVWAVNSRSHDLAFKSHGESENRKIGRQFRQESRNLKLSWITCNLRYQKRFRILGFSLTSIKQLRQHPILVCQVKGCKTQAEAAPICFFLDLEVPQEQSCSLHLHLRNLNLPCFITVKPGRKFEGLKQPCFHQKIWETFCLYFEIFRRPFSNNNRNNMVLNCE